MSLRLKVMLIFLFLFALFASVDFFTDRFFVLPGFMKIEKDEVTKDLARATENIKKEISDLDVLCHDWSAWDDTYQFIQDHNDAYIESNLIVDTFLNNQLNLIYFVDIDGNVVWKKIVDLKTGQEMELNDFPSDKFPKNDPMIAFPLRKQSINDLRITGVEETSKGILMFSSRPIVKSNNKGNALGAIIFGRFLTDDFVEESAKQLKIKFGIYPMREPVALEGIGDRRVAKTIHYPYFGDNSSKGHTLAYERFNDLKGNIAFLIRVERPKTISTIGLHAIASAMLGFILMGLIIFMATIWVLEYFILAPIQKLTHHTHSIRESGDLSARVEISRNDEVGTLAQEFNRMLDTIEAGSKALKTANINLQKDIKERKNVESALQMSKLELSKAKEEWERTFNALEDMVTIHDTKMTILRANRAAAIALGTTPEHLIGRYCHEVFFQKNEPSLLYHVGQEGTPSTQMIEINDPHLGKIFQVTLTPIYDESKKFIGIVRIAKDITDQKNLEEHLQQVRKLEAIGTLAGGIAHDFNNILMSIMLNIEFTMELIQDEAIQERLDVSLKSCRRAKELVEQILTFSRKSESELVPLMISPIIRESLKMLRSSLPATIEIISEIDEISGTVLAAPTHIHQILLNLCTNAAYTMKEKGGILTVRLQEEAECRGSHLTGFNIAPGPCFKLTVSDTGHGIAPDVIDKIFDPFFTTKKPGEGTGMGLSVIHGILLEIGGAIHVESELGQGASFDVCLPKTDAKTDAKPVANPAGSPGIQTGAARLLIIDDEKQIVNTLHMSLSHFGFDVTGRVHSRDALTIFEENPYRFDLVITDQTMPYLTGLELAEKIHDIRRDIPIILCTGFSDLVNQERLDSLGIKRLIMKPIISSELRDVINDILKGDQHGKHTDC